METKQYRTNMYAKMEDGTEKLIGYADWSQDAKAQTEAGGAFFVRELMEVEEALIDRLLHFRTTERLGGRED